MNEDDTTPPSAVAFICGLVFVLSPLALFFFFV